MAKYSFVPPAQSVLQQVRKVFLFIADLLMYSILILFFLQSRAAVSICYSIGAHAATTLFASTVHYQVQFYHSRSVDLTLSNTDGSTLLWRKVPNFTPCIFSIPQLLSTLSETYSAFLAIRNIFCFTQVYCMHCKVSRQAADALACISYMNYWIEVPKASIFKHLQGPQHSWEHFCNHMRFARPQISTAFTQPRPQDCKFCIYAVVFNLCCIYAASFKPLHPLRCTHTSSHSLSCTHLCSKTWKTWCETSRRTHDSKMEALRGSALRFESNM